MFMNLCPHAIGMTGVPLHEIMDIAVKAGFQGVDFPAGEIKTQEQAREAKQLLEQRGLQWGLFDMPCDFLMASEEAFKLGVERLEAMLPVIREAGCTRTYNHIWPGSNDREYHENFSWHVNRLKTLTDLLEEYHVKMGVEFIGPRTLRDTFKYPFIHSLPQAVELADAVSPNLGFAIDFFHFYTSGGSLADLSACLSGREIINLHVNDAIPGREPDEQLDTQRAMPMSTGVIDAAGILKEIKKLKYDGPMICEPFLPARDRLAAMDKQDAARETTSSLKNCLLHAGLV